MIPLLKLIAIAFLVATNAFFVSSEFALVSVRRARLEARAAAGSKNARAALRLLDNPTIFISAVQFGITLASLALGWIGEPAFAEFAQLCEAHPGIQTLLATLLAVALSGGPMGGALVAGNDGATGKALPGAGVALGADSVGNWDITPRSSSGDRGRCPGALPMRHAVRWRATGPRRRTPGFSPSRRWWAPWRT